MIDLELKVNSYLEAYRIAKDEKIYVAFSGGADSLALLAILSKVMTTPPIAVYVDHNLRNRAELDLEIQRNIENCNKLGCKLIIHTLEQGEVNKLCKADRITVEAAARLLRYSYFDSLDSFVATAHNYDDQVESVFMRLLSGSTFQSLAGIRRKRGKYIRPLLDIKKSDIESYCLKNNLTFSYDSTNSQLFCLRNKIRHLVAPALNDELKQSLVNISNNISTFLDRINILASSNKGFYRTLDRKAFLSLIEIEADITILNFISFYTQDRVSKRELESIKNNIKEKKAIETNDYIITCTDSEIRIYPPKFYYSARLRVDDEFMGLKFIKSDSKDALVLPCDDFIIRVNEEGDEIETVKARTKVKDLLSAMKIPYCLVVCSKEGIVGVFAACFGGKNRISKEFYLPNYEQHQRYDVISSTLLEF